MNSTNDKRNLGLQSMFMAPVRLLGSGFSKMSSTRLNYWGEFLVDLALIAVLVFEGWRMIGGQLLVALSAVALGLLIYSFLEYVFHRWLFHNGPAWFSDGHNQHHVNPIGYDSLPFFLPALVSLGLARLYMLVMPTGVALLVAATVTFGYVLYGLGHFAIHHVRFRNPLLRRWAALHHIHHYHPDRNFGVTTPLWDILLRTKYARHSPAS